MKLAAVLLVTSILAAAPALARTDGGTSTTHGFPNARLIAAAKAAPLKQIDSLETYCDTDTPIVDWLRRLTGGQARRIDWTAGRCDLVNNLNPLDGGGSYCVQATITLRHPKNRHDQPEVEIYLEDPRGRKPGEVYAFRASFDGLDGPDYIRFRKDFDTEWRGRFKDTPPPACQDA